MPSVNTLLVLLRTLQGVVAGTLVGLLLFVSYVRLANPRAAAEEEGSRLLMVFIAFVATGSMLGATAGLVVRRRNA